MNKTLKLLVVEKITLKIFVMDVKKHNYCNNFYNDNNKS